DGHTFTTSMCILDGARYWQGLVAPSSATIVTVWSSGLEPGQHYAHNCTHDVHGAGGEAHWGACRSEYEIQPKERDPEAASHHQFSHVITHTDFLSSLGASDMP